MVNRKRKANRKRGRNKKRLAFAESQKLRRQHHGHHKPPVCPKCNRPCRMATKDEVNPHSQTRSNRHYWVCRNWPNCGNMTAADFWSGKPGGEPASGKTRWYRRYGHLLMSAVASALGRRGTGTVYPMIAEELNLPLAKTHWGMFNLATAQRAAKFLEGWLHARNLPLPHVPPPVSRQGRRRSPAGISQDTSAD